MNDERRDARLLDILRRAANAQSVPDGGHLADDDERLACWAQGLLSPAAYDELIEHLSLCPRCRQQVAGLVRDGALEPIEVDIGRPDRRRFVQAAARLAIAAGILGALGTCGWYWHASRPQPLLAQAEQELRAGDAAGAMDRLDQLLTRELPAAVRSRAVQLYAEAGYSAAAAALRQQDFDAVRETVDRVARQGGESPALLNLKLRADEKSPVEVALSAQGSLWNYQHELNGSVLTAAVPPLDEPRKQDLEQAAAKYPDDATLRLNLGQCLLSQNELADAATCFQAVLDKDTANALARLGLGMVRFKQQAIPQAGAEFEAALKLAPENLDVQLNWAIFLEHIGRRAEARKYFRSVRERTREPQLQDDLDKWLAP